MPVIRIPHCTGMVWHSYKYNIWSIERRLTVGDLWIWDGRARYDDLSVSKGTNSNCTVAKFGIAAEPVNSFQLLIPLEIHLPKSACRRFESYLKTVPCSWRNYFVIRMYVQSSHCPSPWKPPVSKRYRQQLYWIAKWLKRRVHSPRTRVQFPLHNGTL